MLMNDMVLGRQTNLPQNSPYNPLHHATNSIHQATETPPRKVRSKAKNASITARFLPLRMLTVGVLLAPAPTMTARLPES